MFFFNTVSNDVLREAKDELVSARARHQDAINGIDNVDRIIALLDEAYSNDLTGWSAFDQHHIRLLWRKLNSLIQLKPINSLQNNINLEATLKAVADIDFYHPEWLPNFIDRDKDIYKCCFKLSQNTASLWYDNPDSENLKAAIRQLNDLSKITGKINPHNTRAKTLLGIGFLTCCIGAILYPHALIGESIMAGLLWAIMVISGGVGAHLYMENPSPQGSKKLQQAISALLVELSNPCEVSHNMNKESIRIGFVAEFNDGMPRTSCGT